MQRIVISITNDISTDQRVHRVCTTLIEMGFDILVIGRRLPNSFTLERAYKTSRMKLLFNKGFLFYAEYNLRLFFKLLFTRKDLLLANDLDTLVPNFLISRLQSKKLIFDSHELFSEIPELVERPKVKWFWRVIEKRIIPKLKNCYTVSQSIADYYQEHFGTDFRVIKNCPISSSLSPERREVPFLTFGKKIILYQGSVNLGRGLELMIETMPLIKNVILVIVGDGDILESLKLKVKNAGLKERVRFLGKLTPETLKNITSKATIGISFEEDLGLNYRYALPNKLFDYIQAQIPVVVSNLPEMKKMVEDYDVGMILKVRTPQNLTEVINSIFERGKGNWASQLKKASEELVWEKESVELQKLINNLT